MTVTIVQNSTSDKSAGLVKLQAAVTALAAVSNPSASQAQALKHAQEDLVRSCIDTRRLDPAAIISTVGSTVFSTAWLAKYHPEIAKLQTQVNNGTTGDARTQLSQAQQHAVDDAMAQGITSAANILSVMT